jgi:DNA-binding NtrC family response regulator
VRDQLERLVQELLEKGVLYDDARREFEKMFIARALQRSKGNVGDAAELLGMHRNTIARKISEYRIKRVSWKPNAGRSSRAIGRCAPRCSRHART